MTINSKMTEKTIKQLEKITGEKLTFGRFLWAIRESDEVSLTDRAKRLGISKQHLCDLEHNRKTIRPKLAVEYAKKLGYAKEQFIRLCLQDLVDRDGLNVVIEVEPRSKKTDSPLKVKKAA